MQRTAALGHAVHRNWARFNAEYQRLTKAIKKTASRDLEDLRRKGVLDKIGTTGAARFASSHAMGT